FEEFCVELLHRNVLFTAYGVLSLDNTLLKSPFNLPQRFPPTFYRHPIISCACRMSSLIPVEYTQCTPRVTSLEIDFVPRATRQPSIMHSNTLCPDRLFFLPQYRL
ncbi:hypothetical protein PV326_005371, partial [Microctonus aethiopoides]